MAYFPIRSVAFNHSFLLSILTNDPVLLSKIYSLQSCLLCPDLICSSFTSPVFVPSYTTLNLRHVLPQVLQGTVPTLQGTVTAMWGTVPALCGTVPALWGTVLTLCGTVPALCGTLPALSGTVPALCSTVPALQGTVPALVVYLGALCSMLQNLGQPFPPMCRFMLGLNLILLHFPSVKREGESTYLPTSFTSSQGQRVAQSYSLSLTFYVLPHSFVFSHNIHWSLILKLLMKCSPVTSELQVRSILIYHYPVISQVNYRKKDFQQI